MAMQSSAAVTRMKESIIRNPSLLEEGLEILDSDLPVLDERPLDLFGLDAQGRICVIVIRDGTEGGRREEGHGNILDDAKFYWHWITTFRDQFLPAAKMLSGRRVLLTSPRMILVCQGYSQALIELASSAGEYTPLTLLQMDPSEPLSGSFEVVLPASSATEMSLRKFEEFQSERVAKLDERNKGFIDNAKSVAYAPVTIESLTQEIPEDRAEDFQGLLSALSALSGVRLSARKNRVVCTVSTGHRAAEVIIGPGGGFSTTVYVYDAAAVDGTRKQDQFSSEDEAGAITAMTAALETFAD